MTYAPLWQQEASQSREAVKIANDLPEPVRSAFVEVAEELGEHLRGDFPDVDAALVGWVVVRVSHGLNGLIRKRPDLTNQALMVITMLAGHHLVGGES